VLQLCCASACFSTTHIHLDQQQRIATHHNKPQQTATHRDTHTRPISVFLDHLQHTATHCNTLHHAATHCNILLHMNTFNFICTVCMCMAVCYGALQCGEACLQCVAVCCRSAARKLPALSPSLTRTLSLSSHTLDLGWKEIPSPSTPLYVSCLSSCSRRALSFFFSPSHLISIRRKFQAIAEHTLIYVLPILLL